MIVFMADENPFTRPSHAMLAVVFFQSFQSGEDGRVFLWLVLFCAKGVVAQWIQPDCFRLVVVELLGDYRTRILP